MKTVNADTLAAALTPTDALAVALSTGPMSSAVMEECLEAAGPMLTHLEAMGFILAAIPPDPRLAALLAAARDIANLNEEDVRDYEQGLCFFCGSPQEVVPGPRGGTSGPRRHRPRHEGNCSYIAIRDALAAFEEKP